MKRTISIVVEMKVLCFHVDTIQFLKNYSS